VTTVGQTLTYEGAIGLAGIFTVTGGTPTQYQIYLNSPADGEVTYNGTPIAVGQTFSETSLDNLVFVGGLDTGSDGLWLRAYDGQWSSWVEADANRHTGVVRGSNQSIAYNQSVALSGGIFGVTGGTPTELPNLP
jgi:hypothetical protein